VSDRVEHVCTFPTEVATVSLGERSTDGGTTRNSSRLGKGTQHTGFSPSAGAMTFETLFIHLWELRVQNLHKTSHEYM